MAKANPETRLVRFDWAMKYLLRNKANFDVLEGFLSALFEDDRIKIVRLLESEANQEEENDKFNRVDLLVEDGRGRKIIIEIQNTRESDYLERIIYGTSKLIIENLELGEDYGKIEKVISVSILYFNLGDGNDYLYHGKTEMRGINTQETLKVRKRHKDAATGKVSLRDKDIFPEYYLIQVERFQNIVRKRIDEWVYLIKNSQVKEDSTSRNIHKAKEKLRYMNMTPEERKRHDRYLGNLARERDILLTEREEGQKEAEEKFKKVKEKLEAEKKAEAAARRKAEAEKQKAEAERQAEAAALRRAELEIRIFRLLRKGLSAEEIAEDLGQSIEWVRNILEEE
jgi:predicted transposase/invertase (TIGR01784 family)